MDKPLSLNYVYVKNGPVQGHIYGELWNTHKY